MNGNENNYIAYQDVSERQPRAAALELIRKQQASIMDSGRQLGIKLKLKLKMELEMLM